MNVTAEFFSLVKYLLLYRLKAGNQRFASRQLPGILRELLKEEERLMVFQRDSVRSSYLPKVRYLT